MKVLLITDEPKLTPLTLDDDVLELAAREAGLGALREAAGADLELVVARDGEIVRVRARSALAELGPYGESGSELLITADDVRRATEELGFEVVMAKKDQFAGAPVDRFDAIIVDLNQGQPFTVDFAKELAGKWTSSGVLHLGGPKITGSAVINGRPADIVRKPISKREFAERLRAAMDRRHVEASGKKGAAVA